MMGRSRLGEGPVLRSVWLTFKRVLELKPSRLEGGHCEEVEFGTLHVVNIEGTSESNWMA
jgi:hypothetical protein